MLMIGHTSSRMILAAAAATLLLGAGTAGATTVTGSYSVSYVAAHGNSPTFSYSGDLPTSNFSVNPTLNGAATAQQNFFTVNPVTNGSDYGCGSNCVNHTADGTITVTFTSLNIGAATPVGGSDLTETALYQAKYTGAGLPCSSGSGQTDCVTWTINNPNGTDPLAITFTNGDTLTIAFFNAEDWAITPKIDFQLSGPSATPLPGALPLFVSGTGLLGFLGWRRKKQQAKAA